ncbi:MAG: TatD family hydrolase [Candidatus Sungbacteria bacterium]|uniref:TatD family hydrolase n=1 Tax=Candidatus Sungiibacteriota bacterium TaxID=2750080 RepID=A0A933DTM1_9BACT|nr:TatD family hydrolase [Candidatus Sungbacteria bacterium]
MSRVIDTHAHVQFTAYDADRDIVIGRALEAGIGMVNVGTQYSTSLDAVRLAEQYPEGLWATAGFHPNHLDANAHYDPQELNECSTERFEYAKFLDLARHPMVVAVGECGLDYAHFTRERSERRQNGASAEAIDAGGLQQEEIKNLQKQQQEVFLQQVILAAELKKPLVLHCRQAFADLIKILKSKSRILNSPAGVVHFFSGTWDDARTLLDLGFFLGFGGVVTFAREYDEVVKKAPLDRLLLETDAPYVSPAPHRGKRNEPAYIVETAKKIAQLRGVPLEEIAAGTAANTRTLFGVS